MRSHRPKGRNGWCTGIVAREPPLRPARPTRDSACCADSSAKPQRAQSRSKAECGLPCPRPGRWCPRVPACG
jgi:hypothetical protein